MHEDDFPLAQHGLPSWPGTPAFDGQPQPAGDAPELPLARRLGHDRADREPVGGRPHEDLVRRRRLLEPGGHVQRLTRRERRVAGLGDDLPGLDPDTDTKLPLRPDRVEDRRRGAHRALGVVLVRHRGAEDRHHVVADVLVDAAAVAVDLLTEPLEAAVDQVLDRLGVHRLRDRRVARQVCEDHRHLAPLLGELLE